MYVTKNDRKAGYAISMVHARMGVTFDDEQVKRLNEQLHKEFPGASIEALSPTEVHLTPNDEPIDWTDVHVLITRFFGQQTMHTVDCGSLSQEEWVYEPDGSKWCAFDGHLAYMGPSDMAGYYRE